MISLGLRRCFSHGVSQNLTRKSVKLCCLKSIRHNFHRGTSNVDGNDDLRKWKFIKHVFWTVIFGSTLTLAILMRKRRRESAQEFLKHYEMLPYDPNFKDGGKSFRYKGFVFPIALGKNIFTDLTKFHPREDDVFVVSFPKTGTTWVQEIVYLVGNDLDFATAESTSLEGRFPFLEFIYPGITSIEKMPSPRLIKTHLPFSLLPEEISEKKCKIIYVTRNPKDVAVSFYHFLQMLTMTDYQGTFKDLVFKFLHDELPYCPFWKHVMPFWERRNTENILFLKYEDLHKDLAGAIRTIAEFLGKQLTDDEVKLIVDHCNFKSMQSNPMINYDHWTELGLWKKDRAKFLRKGQVGDWQNYFTPGLNATFNEWIEKNTQNTGLTFDYVIDDHATIR